MKRSEQDIRFQWDLTKIYPDTAAWEAAMQEAEAALAPLAAIPGTLGTSKEAFKKGLDTVYASMFKVEMPYVYAFLKKIRKWPPAAKACSSSSAPQRRS